MARARPWFANRTTGDLLILLIASTVCFSVLASGLALFIVTLTVPDRDTTAGFHAISDVVNTLIGLLAGFLAGLFVPLWLLPTWLQVIAQATPFPSMLMFPTDILSGRTDGIDAVKLVGAQLLWLAAMVAVGQLMTRRGRRHLEVQGG